jgi:hypothetical protein
LLFTVLVPMPTWENIMFDAKQKITAKLKYKCFIFF